CSLDLLLQLPIQYLFLSYSRKHWLQRCKNSPAESFFIYDQYMKRLRIRVEGEYPMKPKLCRKLKKDILDLRTVKLRPFIYQYIVRDTTINANQQNNTCLNKALTETTSWKTFSPVTYRAIQETQTPIISGTCNQKGFKRFWSLPILLPARICGIKYYQGNYQHQNT
ncbi:uncharacterized protein EV154DRAFT_429976, partial [Mucor mucedo]|uniref:uncharacterized protein n=1 Tax=Mucor mucedo TaxID=29922 RepID=UPI00221ED08B